MNGNHAAGVQADNTHIQWQATTGYLFSCKNLNQLFFPARGVLGGKGDYFDAAIFGSPIQSRYSLGLIVLYADQSRARFQQLLQYFNALDNLLGSLPHQYVVGGDIRFAFRAVDDQCCNRASRPGGQFDGSGKAGSAHTGDAGMAYLLQHFLWGHIAVVGYLTGRYPFVLAVGGDHNTHCQQTRGVCDKPFLDRRNCTRGWRVYWHADKTQGLCNHLALENSFAHRHHRTCGCANVLGQWQHQLRGNARVPYGKSQGLVFIFRRVNTAVEVEDFSHAARSCD